MSRQWETHLQANTAAWDDFCAWLDALELGELRKLAETADTSLQRGIVKGIQLVRASASLNLREEEQRARRTHD